MKIVIPTAGFGTRLRPHTWSKPKPLIPVAGKPVLAHVLDTFRDIQSLEEVIFIVGYLGDQIESYVSEGYPDMETRFVTQGEMLGQSHAIGLAREFLQGPMLMVFVDTLIFADLSRLKDEPADGVIWVKEVEDPRRFGVTEVDAEDKVMRLIEKPQDMDNNLAVVGFYYFKEAGNLIEAIDQQMERQIQLKGEFFLADAVNIMLEGGSEMRVERVDVSSRYCLQRSDDLCPDNNRINSQMRHRGMRPPAPDCHRKLIGRCHDRALANCKLAHFKARQIVHPVDFFDAEAFH